MNRLTSENDNNKERIEEIKSHLSESIIDKIQNFDLSINNDDGDDIIDQLNTIFKNV